MAAAVGYNTKIVPPSAAEVIEHAPIAVVLI
jgi:hypothetical protein